jgi:hypothetical protein
VSGVPVGRTIQIFPLSKKFQKTPHARVVQRGHCLPLGLNPGHVELVAIGGHQIFNVQLILGVERQQLEQDYARRGGE